MTHVHPTERIADARALVAKLSTEEKARLVIGRDTYTTVPFDEIGLPSAWMADGPHGLRKTAGSDALGMGAALPSTCFPTSVMLASTWNPELVRRVGAAIGREARALDVQVVLGPGVNVKRSPLGGRNFEYYSEDPYLAGELAVAFIDGVQGEGVGTSLKHFAANSQELDRMITDSQVDERTLREIYLPAFEAAVTRARPWTVMCAYNLLNGTYCSEHRELLTTILRDEWGFEGLVVSDWGAVDDRVAGLRAGLDLEMPGSGPYHAELVVDAVGESELDESALDEAAVSVAAMALAGAANSEPEPFDEDAHHHLARAAAIEGSVLLKNEGGLLPLGDGAKRVAVIGRFAMRPRIQGAGSSRVNPTRTDNAWDELRALDDGAREFVFAEGYGPNTTVDGAMIEAAARVAAEADVALLFVGIPAGVEAEGQDREGLGLPEAHDALAKAVLAAQPNTVVVLTCGSAVASPWMERARAFLLTSLAGQGGGQAVARIALGLDSPSGRLAETFPRRAEDTGAFHDFPGRDGILRFGEGVFVGYRWLDAHGIEPLFAFGHGLGYSEFTYSDIRIEQPVEGSAEVTVRVTVTNTGKRAAAEVVQLYVHDAVSTAARPPQELKGFEKLSLAPGEAREVAFQLGERSFATWDTRTHGWRIEGGEFELRVGASSRDVRLRANVWLAGTGGRPALTQLTPIRLFLDLPGGAEAIAPLVARAFGANINAENARQTLLGMFGDTPVGKLSLFSRGTVTHAEIGSLIAALQP